MRLTRMIGLAIALVFAVGASSVARAGLIDAYPDPTLGPTFGVYSPLGEVSHLNPVYSISPRHDFATYFGQTFVALPGLADNLTFNIGNSGGPDGIDFKVLITRTAPASGLRQPTDVIYESGTYTFGASAGIFGTNVGDTGRADVTISLGGLDLVDGETYAWVLDTVDTADGTEGYGFISYRHPLQPDFPGNSTVMVFDLDTNTSNQPWINVSYIDLAYRLSFADGGIPDPVLPVIRSLPSSVPEPSTLDLFAAGLLALAGIQAMRPRRRVAA